MNRRRIYPAIAVALSILVSLAACGGGNIPEDIPAEVEQLMRDYLETCKRSFGEAADYCYFSPEDIEKGYQGAARQSTGYLLEYEIKSAEKLSEDLYAFTLYMKGTGFTNYDGRTEFYHIVARIDDEWAVIVNADSIPPELGEGVDYERYTYNNPDAL